MAADGDALRLSDIYIQDDETKELSRPTVSGDLPREAALYQQVPLS